MKSGSTKNPSDENKRNKTNKEIKKERESNQNRYKLNWRRFTFDDVVDYKCKMHS